MTDIGWCFFPHGITVQNSQLEWVDRVFYPPEKISSFYEGSSSYFMDCPAHKSFIKNFWAVKSPVDLVIEYDEKLGRVSCNQNQMFFDNFILFRTEDFDPEKDLPLFTVAFQYLFVADVPVWIELFPPFLHGGVDNTRVINGTFDIYNWQRPVDFSFEMLDKRKPVSIKKGQPLFYVRFISENLNDNFNLREIHRSEELIKAHGRTRSNAFIPKLTWKLMRSVDRHRPKKLVKNFVAGDKK